MAQLRQIPSIDRLLSAAPEWMAQFPRSEVVESLRRANQDARLQLREGQAHLSLESILDRAHQYLLEATQPSLIEVINATGVILHTNLGRSPLSARALQAVQGVCQGYCNLEIELESGQRGHRHHHLEGLWQKLTGCAGALVVNNCAAAMLLIVDEFARGREVLVSRGELVEIGGSFRIPEVLERGGARLREVGTTNRTYLRDFESALTPETSMLLSTHLSNFAMRGFVHQPRPAELVDMAQRRDILSVFDLGSGLLDGDTLGEPTIRQAVRDGWDLVAFSGDKLLGGAQAGVILGKLPLLQRLARNPWMRALRLDKLRLAALQGSLLDHLLEPAGLPVVAMLETPLSELKRRANRLVNRLKPLLKGRAEVSTAPSQASLGGGTTPEQLLESWACRITPRSESLEEWARQLRLQNPALLGRLHQGSLWLDMRTLFPAQTSALVRAFQQL